MKQRIAYQCQAVRPKPLMVTVDGVTFALNEKLTPYYRLAEYAGMLDAFMYEMKPYYWKEYMEAVRLKEAAEERKRMLAEMAAEQHRAFEAEKARLRRLRNKNGVTSPITPPNPEKGI